MRRLSLSSISWIPRPSSLVRPSFQRSRSFPDYGAPRVDSMSVFDPQPSSGFTQPPRRWNGTGPPKSLRELATEEEAEVLEALPAELPDAPPYPCPWIASDAQKWLKPLYQRDWRVLRSQNSPHGVGTFALEKQFQFRTHKSTIDFFNDIMGLDGGICEQEGHHPLGLRLTYSGVLITLKTASAKILSDDPKRRPIRKPGVTLRDIRLAFLIERRFEATYKAAGWTLVQYNIFGTMDIDLQNLGLEKLDVERKELERG